MCYNVLCDKYATRQLYGYCPSWALNWEYRKKNIMQEIMGCNADIISLQVREDCWRIAFCMTTGTLAQGGLLSLSQCTNDLTVNWFVFIINQLFRGRWRHALFHHFSFSLFLFFCSFTDYGQHTNEVSWLLACVYQYSINCFTCWFGDRSG